MDIATEQLLHDIVLLVLRDAATRRTSVGFEGKSDDGGATMLEQQVRFYHYGMDGTIPPEWSKYEKEAKTQADPEYNAYLRLKKKFE